MMVEIGAGARAHDGYLALDVNPRNADVVGDAQRLPFRDASIEALRAIDVLEHCSYRVTDMVLAEWARVCAPNAHIYIQVPDAALIMRWYDYADQRLRVIDTGPCPTIIGAAWRLLGGHADGRYVDTGDDFRWNAHYSLWDAEHLMTSLDRAGFTVDACITNRHPNLCATARRR